MFPQYTDNISELLAIFIKIPQNGEEQTLLSGISCPPEAHSHAHLIPTKCSPTCIPYTHPPAYLIPTCPSHARPHTHLVPIPLPTSYPPTWDAPPHTYPPTQPHCLINNNWGRRISCRCNCRKGSKVHCSIVVWASFVITTNKNEQTLIRTVTPLPFSLRVMRA